MNTIQYSPQIGPLYATGFPWAWAHPSPELKRSLDRFRIFCRAHYTRWQTDKPRYSVVHNRRHLPT